MKRIYSKEKFLKKWNSIERIYQELILGLVLLVGIFFLSWVALLIGGYKSPVKIIIIGLKSNALIVFLLMTLVASAAVFIAHFFSGTPRTWRWRKVAYFALLTVTTVTIISWFFGVKINLAPIQERVVRDEERTRYDSLSFGRETAHSIEIRSLRISKDSEIVSIKRVSDSLVDAYKKMTEKKKTADLELKKSKEETAFFKGKYEELVKAPQTTVQAPAVPDITVDEKVALALEIKKLKAEVALLKVKPTGRKSKSKPCPKQWPPPKF